MSAAKSADAKKARRGLSPASVSDENLPDEPKEQSLPPVEDGEMAQVLAVHIKPKQTRPPTHYTEGALIEDMRGAAKFVENDPDLKKVLKDASGLGTSATRDSVLETLKHHGYLEKNGKYLVATEKGISFVQWLRQVMPELTDVAVTARWEAELSIVSKKGGGAAFEERLTTRVREMTARLKSSPPLKGGDFTTQTTEKTLMPESGAETRRASKPTDKMLDYAKAIAKSIGKRVPDDVMVDFDTCRSFIDDHKDSANRPTDKQLTYAQSIAKAKNAKIPAEVLVNKKLLSAWIDEHR